MEEAQSYTTLMVLGVLVVLLLAGSLIVALRWRMVFSARVNDGNFYVMPDKHIKANLKTIRKVEKGFLSLKQDHAKYLEDIASVNRELTVSLLASDSKVREDQKRSFDALQAVLSVVKSLREETQILRLEIQRQAEELDRHRKGYDTDILSRSLIPVSRVHRLIQSEIEKGSSSDGANLLLETALDEHLEVLETNGVRMIYPELGSRYRDQTNVRHPPELTAPGENDQPGTIAAVLQPAYVLERSDNSITLLEAEVSVFLDGSDTRAARSGENTATNGQHDQSSEKGKR